MKTIFMAKSKFDKWLKALRSGDYVQGPEYLHNSSDNTFCCLGVLQHCLTGKVEREGDSDASLPTEEWLRANNIRFLSDAGFIDTDPSTSNGKDTFAGLNDSGASFKEIAKRLEKAYGGSLKNYKREVVR